MYLHEGGKGEFRYHLHFPHPSIFYFWGPTSSNSCQIFTAWGGYMYLSIPPQVTPHTHTHAPACALHGLCAPHHIRPIQILEILKFFKFSFFEPVTLSCLSPKVPLRVCLSVASCMALCMCLCARAVCDVPHTKYMGKGKQLSF